MLHKIKVRSRVISIVSAPAIVVDGVDSDTMLVDLDSEWLAYDTVKVIYSAGLDDDQPVEVEWSEGAHLIPWEKLTGEAPLYVSVCGYVNGTQRAVTALMDPPMRVVARGEISGSAARTPTVDAYQQAYADAMAATQTANAAAASANAAAASASTAASDASAAATAAGDAATAAGEAAASASAALAALAIEAEDDGAGTVTITISKGE